MHAVLIFTQEDADNIGASPFEGIEIGYIATDARDAEDWIMAQSDDHPEWWYLATPIKQLADPRRKSQPRDAIDDEVERLWPLCERTFWMPAIAAHPDTPGDIAPWEIHHVERFEREGRNALRLWLENDPRYLPKEDQS